MFHHVFLAQTMYVDLLEKQLYTKASQIPNAGKGLYTKKDIAKGDRIVEYTGRVSSWKDAYHQDGANPYIFFASRNHVIDASVDVNSLGRYANDARGLTRIKGLNNNCSFIKEGKRVFIEADKNIPAGSELFVGYGKEYWDTIRSNIRIDKMEAKKKLTAEKKLLSKKAAKKKTAKKKTAAK
jgi:uncharacterized protein